MLLFPLLDLVTLGGLLAALRAGKQGAGQPRCNKRNRCSRRTDCSAGSPESTEAEPVETRPRADGGVREAGVANDAAVAGDRRVVEAQVESIQGEGDSAEDLGEALASALGRRVQHCSTPPFPPPPPSLLAALSSPKLVAQAAPSTSNLDLPSPCP